MNTVIRNPVTATVRNENVTGSAKRLSLLLRHAIPSAETIEVDDERQVARMPVFVRGGAAVLGTLFLNRERGVVRFDIRLGALRALSLPQAVALLELNVRTRLSWICQEADHGIACLRAASECRGSEIDAIRALACDIDRPLRDHAAVQIPQLCAGAERTVSFAPDRWHLPRHLYPQRTPLDESSPATWRKEHKL